MMVRPGRAILPALLWLAGVARAQTPANSTPTRAPEEPLGESVPDETLARPARPPASAGYVRVPVYTLKRCLQLAELNYPKVHEARAKLQQKRAQRWQSRTEPFNNFTFTGGLALVPRVEGTAVYSLSSDLPVQDDMRVAWQAGVETLIPLWTFGKITNTWDAADAQVRVGENEVQKERNEVRLSVRRAFYGVQLARDALVLVNDALARIDKYLGKLEQAVKDGEGDEIDLLKLKMHREELLARKSEAQKQAAVGLGGLKFLTGVSSGIDVPDVPLTRLGHHLGPLARYLSAARVYRPEINMARAGVLAREALVRVERAKFFPDFALALNAKMANAPSVTDQRNPFVYDIGHGRSFGFGLAMRYKLDFLAEAARYQRATAELEEQRATERYALGGVGFEVEQAFRDAEDAETRLGAFTRATSYAKQWLIQVQQGIDIGTFEDHEIVDPAREYALKRFAQMSATLDYNMALAKLALATGWDTIAQSD